MTSTVLILGAKGRFGLSAARAFAAAGWRVIGQVRPGATPAAVSGVEWLAADVHDHATLVRKAQEPRWWYMRSTRSIPTPPGRPRCCP